MILPQCHDYLKRSHQWFAEVLFKAVHLYDSRSLLAYYPHEENSLFLKPAKQSITVMPREDCILYFSPQGRPLCNTCHSHLKAGLVPPLWPTRRSFSKCACSSSLRCLLPSLKSILLLHEMCGLSYEVRCMAHLSYNLCLLLLLRKSL